MLVFISGGTGFIGGHLRKELLARGHRLRVLLHRQGQELEKGVETVVADPTGQDPLSSLLAGCDAVINLIGIIREFPSRGTTFERLHVQATRSLVMAAEAAGVPRYVQMSALGTKPGATSAYHRTKYRAEQLVRESGLEQTIFRPSVVFGPNDSFVNMLAGYIRSYPAVPVIGDGRYPMQPISADDVARCFAMALEMPETIGKTYELCGSDRLSYNDLLDTIGRAIGKGQVRKLHSPLVVMKLIVPFLQKFPAFPLTMDQLQMLVEGNICDSRWQETFHFAPKPFDSGIREYLSP